MKKRTFAVDIDGTITENGGGRIHLDALEALRRLTNMGHDVIFVTGRRQSLHNFCHLLKWIFTFSFWI